MTKERLLQLWASGELRKLAQQYQNLKSLCKALGTTEDAYVAAARRIRAGGKEFPTFGQIKVEERAGAPTVLETTFEEFDDEEPTNSNVEAPPVIEETGPRPKTIADEMEERRDKATIGALRAKLAEAYDKIAEYKLHLDVAIAAGNAKYTIDPIVPREKASGRREAVAVALASDWHIEERVDPESVNGVNEYNLAIAQKRVERFFSGFTSLIQYHQPHFNIRDGILWLGGDLITGYLREENLEHNELSPVQAIATLHVWLESGIRSVLENNTLESLKVVCNSGNHGRLTDKVRPSTREANSIEWLLYNSLARDFADEKRIQFSLPHGSQTYVDVYDWTIRFLHGDDAKFGGGVGGITIPLYKALARWETVRHADLTCLGHFHQYHDLSDLVVNGSLIGYNPYSLSIGARYEEPRQAFFLMDRRRGKTMPADIWVKDVKE